MSETAFHPKTITPFLLLALLYGCFLFVGIKNVQFSHWDEGFYINAARAYLSTPKPYPIPDHPPFGKEIVAVGIYLFGDNPIGWRLFSIFFGSLSVGLIALFIYLLTGHLKVSLFVGLLTFLDPLLYIHFRMSLLDPPLTALLLLSTFLTYLFYRSVPPRWALLIALGITLGLSTATKMLTIAFFPILGGMVLLKIYRTSSRPMPEMLRAVLLIGGLAAATFTGTYLILGYTLQETWDLVVYMFAWHRTAGAESFLTSRWYEWLYIGNPIFYFYKRLGPDQWQTVIATGNLVLWVGAELAALYALIRHRKRPEIWMLALLIVLQFALYTQKRSTFIHYMTEILPFLYILLGVAIADLFERYGKKYKTILQVDLGLFAVGAFLIFYNYWPFIFGRPISAELFQRASGFKVVPSGMSQASVSASPSPTPRVLENGP